MSGFALIKENTIIKAIINKCAKTGCGCLVALSNLNYGVVLAPLITHYSRAFIKVCINFQDSLPKLNFFNTHIKKE